MAIKRIPCGGFFYDDESVSFDGKVMKSKNKSQLFIVDNEDASSSQQYPYVSLFPVPQDDNWDYTELVYGEIDEQTGEFSVNQVFPLLGCNLRYIGFGGIDGTQGNEEQIYKEISPTDDYVGDDGFVYFSSSKYKFRIQPIQ